MTHNKFASLSMGLSALVYNGKYLVQFFAVLPALYFLNLMIQTDVFSIKYIVVGCVWLLLIWNAYRHLSVSRILFFGVVASLFWACVSHSTPVSDFLTFYERSRAFSTGEFSALLDSKSPPTIIYYSAYVYLLGDSFFSVYLASALAWSLGGYVFFLALKGFSVSSDTAKFIFAVLMFYPGFIFYSPVVSSEAVYYLISSSCFWALSRLVTSPGFFAASYLGVGLGLLFLTRSIGVVLLISIAPLAFRWTRRLYGGDVVWQAIRAKHICLVFISFSLVIILHGAWHWTEGRGFQWTSSPWGAYNLLAGTNRSSSGGYNKDDLVLAGFRGEERLSHEEASEKAVDIAVKRISSAPKDFFVFALTDKVKRLWSQSFSYSWGLIKSPVRDHVDERFRSSILALIHGAFAISIVFCLLCLVYTIFKANAIMIPILTPVYGYAILHLFIEVQGRYQLTITPFILALSAYFLHRVVAGLAKGARG